MNRPPQVSREMRAFLRQWRNPACPECGSREDVQFDHDGDGRDYLCDVCGFEWRVPSMTERLDHAELVEVVNQVERLVLASVRDNVRVGNLRDVLVAHGFAKYEPKAR
jgi:hypothetical protein